MMPSFLSFLSSILAAVIVLLIFSPSVSSIKTTASAVPSSTARSSSSSSSDKGGSEVPWQSTAAHRSSVKEEIRYAGLPPTIFSPTGRLFAVEKVLEAAKTPGNPRANLLIAIKCPKDQSIVVFSTLITSPHLNTTLTMTTNNETNVTTTTSPLFLVNQTSSSSMTSSSTIFDLTPTCLGGTAGNCVDGAVLKTKLQAFADQIMEQQQDDVLSSTLARRIADHLQVPTQTVGSKSGRMLTSHGVIIGNEQIWRIDPTGQFWNCNACVLGRDSDRAEALLYKTIMKTGDNEGDGNNDNKDLDTLLQNMTSQQVIDLIYDCMNQIIWPTKAMVAKQPASGTASPCVYWHAVILQENSTGSSKSLRPPKRTVRRGAFLPPKIHNDKTES